MFLSCQVRGSVRIHTLQLPECQGTPCSKQARNLKLDIECGFTLKRVRDMIRAYSQLHRADKYSEHSSIIWSFWPNG